MTAIGVVTATALFFLALGRASAWAATACDVPAEFHLAIEQRQIVAAGNAGLMIVRPPPRSALQAGDVVKQANGRRTNSCADLEAAAGEALAKGLLLLVAAERNNQTIVVALAETTIAVADVEKPTTGAAGEPPAVSPAEPVGREARSAPPPAPSPLPTARPHREAALPTRAGASTELVAKTVAAAAVLHTVDDAARLTVPLAVYERRIDDAKNAVAALHVDGEGAEAVRTVIDEAFGYHETARDIRRYKAAELTHARVDQRGAEAISLPYFSDSEVPRWVERYPFLSESLQQAPRTTHLLLPGEMAGRWSPDRAVELLWERAAQTAARLATWGAGG